MEKLGVLSDVDTIHKGTAHALLYQLPNGSYLSRLEYFKAGNGPGLTTYLAKQSDITAASQVAIGLLSLGKLKSNIGNQNYVIPVGLDLSKYNSAVIWRSLLTRHTTFSKLSFSQI